MASGKEINVPPFESVWAQIDIDVDQVTKDTAAYRFEGLRGLFLKALMVVGGGVLIVGFAAWLLIGLAGLLIVFFGLGLLAVGAFVGLKRAGKSRDSYAATVKGPLLQQLLASLSLYDPVDGSTHPLRASYEVDGQIPIEKLASTGLFFDNRMVHEDVINGVLGSTEFVLADLKWQSAQEPQPPSKTDPTKRDMRKYRRMVSERYRKEELSRGVRVSRTWGELNADAELLWHQHHREDQLTAKLLKLVEEKMRENYKLGASTLFFSAAFPKRFTSDTYFMPTVQKKGLESMNSKDAEASGLEPMDMSGIDLPKGIQGWTNDQAEARYVLTPQLLVALNDLIAESGTDAVGISFTGNRFNIALGMDENYFSLDPANSDIKASTERIYNDVVRCISITQIVQPY